MRRFVARLRWRRWPLALRLSVVIFVTQLVIFVPGLILFLVVQQGFPASPVEYYATAPDLLASLRTGPDGKTRLEPDDMLRRHLLANPTLRVAVIDRKSRTVLPGSDQAFVSLIDMINKLGLDPTDFDIENLSTPSGEMVAIYYARTFDPADLPLSVYRLILDNLPNNVLLSAGMSAATAVVVWLTFRPLRQAARSMAGIDLDSLDARIAQEHVPAEVRVFARTVNAALDRIATGVGVQRRFVANAAHELRTPISVIGARLEMLPDGEMRRDLLGDVERLAAMVGQLLAIARFGDSACPADDELRLDRIARDVVARQAPVALGRGRQLALEVRAAPAPMRGNLPAIESALANVIDNAIHAEPPGGTVEVTVGPGARIEVADHGPGLSPEDRERAFEPFWRGDATRPGSGLGLAIARAAMAMHGGTAAARATPGGGATFVLALEGASSPA